MSTQAVLVEEISDLERQFMARKKEIVPEADEITPKLRTRLPFASTPNLQQVPPEEVLDLKCPFSFLRL